MHTKIVNIHVVLCLTIMTLSLILIAYIFIINRNETKSYNTKIDKIAKDMSKLLSHGKNQHDYLCYGTCVSADNDGCEHHELIISLNFDNDKIGDGLDIYLFRDFLSIYCERKKCLPKREISCGTY